MLDTVAGAVRTSLEILQAHERLGGDTARGQRMAQNIDGVLEALEATGARWALVGAHAVGVLTEPRATLDFDFVVEHDHVPTVVDALRSKFGALDAEDIGAAVRLRKIDVDLIRSTSHPLFREALDRTTTSGRWRVPVAEVIIALKFLAALSPWRGQDRRHRDLADLIAVYRAVGRDSLDRTLLRELAGTVYPCAEKKFEELTSRIDRGEPITL